MSGVCDRNIKTKQNVVLYEIEGDIGDRNDTQRNYTNIDNSTSYLDKCINSNIHTVAVIATKQNLNNKSLTGAELVEDDVSNHPYHHQVQR